MGSLYKIQKETNGSFSGYFHDFEIITVLTHSAYSTLQEIEAVSFIVFFYTLFWLVWKTINHWVASKNNCKGVIQQ